MTSSQKCVIPADLSSLFANTKKPDELLRKLSIISGTAINTREDLVIFDEVQECPEALNSLKYFNEDCPELAIVAAGSLLGVKIGKSRKGGSRGMPKSYPVGKVELLDVEPMSFDRRATTFKNYVKAHSPKWAIRFSRRNLKKDGGFVNIPLYLVERFADCF